MAAPSRYTGAEGWLIATDNTYTVPPNAYSSNIKSQMSQAQNYTDFLLSRSSTIYPVDGSNNAISSSTWLIPNDAPANVAFDTFDDTTGVATGLPQQMSPFVDIDIAVWGIYFPAVTGQGQLAAAFGKIQVYGVTVIGLAGNGNDPENITSQTAFQAMVNKIGDKYTSYSTTPAFSGFDGTNLSGINSICTAAQQAGVIITLNGVPLVLV
jgi:hypothetical protein